MTFLTIGDRHYYLDYTGTISPKSESAHFFMDDDIEKVFLTILLKTTILVL